MFRRLRSRRAAGACRLRDRADAGRAALLRRTGRGPDPRDSTTSTAISRPPGARRSHRARTVASARRDRRRGAARGGARSSLRAGHPNSITVAAGDLIGASPLVSAYFLDEPTIDAMNLLGLESQFGRQSRVRQGQRRASADAERRLREASRRRVPCRSSRSAARASNISPPTSCRPTARRSSRRRAIRAVRPDQDRLHRHDAEGNARPGHSGRSCGPGFADEAATANALVPKLKAQGADAIVLLIHQGGKRTPNSSPEGCNGLTGDILADPRQARSGDHDRRVRPHALCLCLQAGARRRERGC